MRSKKEIKKALRHFDWCQSCCVEQMAVLAEALEELLALRRQLER